MNDDCECEKRACPEGLPAWVMTFADLMSLLLAFFVLLFSFSEIDKQAYKEMAGSMKNAFGVQREVRANEPPKGINIIAREFSPGRPIPTPEKEIHQMTIQDYHRYPVMADAVKKNKGKKATAMQQAAVAVKKNRDKKLTAKQKVTVAAGKGNLIENKASHEALERAKRVEHDSEVIREELSKEIKKGLIELEVKDQQIILRIREKGSFPSGSAKIIKPFKEVADKIADVFSGFNGEIVVSGNTDNVPIHTKRFRSNWELSASRAVSVIQELRKQPKLKNKKFQLEAYADTRPLASNKTSQGRAKNRRVEIKLSYLHMPVNIGSFGKQKMESITKQKSATKVISPMPEKNLLNIKPEAKNTHIPLVVKKGK